MRVVDLGIDPTTRMIDVLVVLVIVLGTFGPLVFVGPWLVAISDWVEARPPLVDALAKARSLRFVGVPVGKLILVLFFGPAVGVALLANLLDLDDELPDLLHSPHLEAGRVLGFLALVLIVFLMALGTEVWVKGPDLRTDGLHGILAPQVLGFRARPAILYDLDGKLDPWAPCTWVATPTCTRSTTPVQKRSDSCRSAPRESSWSTRSPASCNESGSSGAGATGSISASISESAKPHRLVLSDSMTSMSLR